MFNSAVRKELEQPYIEREQAEIIDFQEMATRFKRIQRMSLAKRKEFFLSEAIDEYRRHKNVLLDDLNNTWRVYTLCKCLSNIAEIEGIDFKKYSLSLKIKITKELIGFVPYSVLVEGVQEFHESGWCK